MSADSPSLEDVRRQIDAIDAALQEGLIKRVALLDQVIKAKAQDDKPGQAMRPGREAAILRRIAERHHGELPLAVVFRIWREIVNAVTALQGPISVAVCAPERSVGYWDLSRNHFGASTPMTLHVAPTVVLRNVVERPGTVGVLPEPQDEEKEPWWLLLASEARSGSVPRIIWRLPFFASGTGRFESLGAMVVACIAPEETGLDETVAAFECDLDVSRGRLLEGLESVGLVGRVIATHEADDSNNRMHLALVTGFVGEDDPRLEELAEVMNHSLVRAVVLGAYPVPIGESRSIGQAAS